MKNPTNKLAALSAVALMATGHLLAYTVITRDGHRIDSRSKPEIRGIQAYMRIEPTGQLVVIHEERIDWVRTEAANQTRPRAIVPQKKKADQEIQAALPSGPIEHQIRGGAPEVSPGLEATTEPETKSVEAAPQGAPRVTKPSAPDSRSQEAIVLLQSEHAKVRALYEKALVRKEALEHELAELQNRQVGNAATDKSDQRTIRELQDSIENLRTRIGKYETRMNDIRGEVIQHGGSLND